MVILVFQGKGHFINRINLKIDVTVTLLFLIKNKGKHILTASMCKMYTPNGRGENRFFENQ